MAGSATPAPIHVKPRDYGRPRDRVAVSTVSDPPGHAQDDDPKVSDPPLLQKHSEVRSYTTSRFTYPAVRTFYRRHPKADELPTQPAPIPLLVFIHGLGGSAAQFQPLLTTLIHVSSCLAIDLPGCGVSEFAPAEWAAYATDALVELLETVIEGYRERNAGQGVVLIGHSMGASLCCLLASKTSPCSSRLSEHVLGLVAICPPSQPPSRQQVSLFRKLLWIPTAIFNLWRAWDRRGGTESASVRRFVGPEADLETRRMQLRFNNQSRTPVWRRMAWGSLPVYGKDGKPRSGLPGQGVWEGLQLPVFLITGANDHVTPPSEVERIKQWLLGSRQSSHPVQASSPGSQALADSAAPIDTSMLSAISSRGNAHGHALLEEPAEADCQRVDDAASQTACEDPSTPRDDAPETPPLPYPNKTTVEAMVLPAPATHALLYNPATARVLAGLVSDFLGRRVSGRLSLGWQLQFLSREGKWDVKNLAKWQRVAPVSAPIAGGVFYAMKTLREVDDMHCPSGFVADWGGVIGDIVDISHDTPVYNPRGLESAGIRYHKLPSVSKIPPTDEEADAFVALVDKIRVEQGERRRPSRNPAQPTADATDGLSIGVHCHYGFNRTGFFIVCYLVERCGFSTQAAIDEFARARPHGIRHQHFLDRLFIRYSALKMSTQPKTDDQDRS